MANEKKHHVCIVDDDPFILDMYAKKFGEEGFEVMVARNGEEALKTLEQAETSPDILLLDLAMSTMDGFDLLQSIRANQMVPNAKVLVLSNVDNPEDIEKAQQYQIDDYIIKANLTPSEVVDKVRQTLA